MCGYVTIVCSVFVVCVVCVASLIPRKLGEREMEGKTDWKRSTHQFATVVWVLLLSDYFLIFTPTH